MNSNSAEHAMRRALEGDRDAACAVVKAMQRAGTLSGDLIAKNDLLAGRRLVRIEELLDDQPGCPKYDQGGDCLRFHFADGGAVDAATTYEIICNIRLWFEHVDELGDMAGAIVWGVIAKGWEELARSQFIRGDDEEERAFWDVITSKGTLSFEVRNSNNGYYAGVVRWYDAKL